MILAPDTASRLEPHSSLRERKKLATRRGIRRAALELIAERGFSHVTIEDIAAAADVSPRTFFNYFPSKEAVLFGADPGRAEEVRAQLVHDMPGHSALEVLRVVLAERARQLAAELAELGGDPVRWAAQMKAAHADPQLRAAQASHMAQVESSFASALAERLGTDPDRDPYPMLLASAATGVLRATMSFWASSGGGVPLEQLVDAAFRALADGFPENRSLRDLALATGPRPGEAPRADTQSRETERTTTDELL
ncbi:MAG: TetR/AcrR family transcriptional regulator [Actinomycetota bacterium]|nr:TetR/AcrR family transcriptional regulator [Actinomycetota bacterium]